MGQINYNDGKETYLSFPNKWIDLTSALGIQLVIISTMVPWFSRSWYRLAVNDTGTCPVIRHHPGTERLQFLHHPNRI